MLDRVIRLEGITRESRVFDGLARVVVEKAVPENIQTVLDQKIEDWAGARTWAMSEVFHGNEYRLIAAAGGRTSKGRTRAEDLVRMGMRSDDERIRESALDGLVWWIEKEASSHNTFRGPTLECIRDVGMAVASQRRETARGAMAAAIAVLKRGGVSQIDSIEPFAVEGLDKWWKALRYDRADTAGTDWDKTVVELRRMCVGLAHAMRVHGRTEHSIVQRWIKAAETDPMAEVRYAVDLAADW